MTLKSGAKEEGTPTASRPEQGFAQFRQLRDVWLVPELRRLVPAYDVDVIPNTSFQLRCSHEELWQLT